MIINHKMEDYRATRELTKPLEPDFILEVL